MAFDVVSSALESGVQVLTLSGTMTMGSQLQRFEWMVENLLKEQHTRIVVDMSKIGYLDSSAIGVLVACQSLAKNSGGQLRLAAVGDRVGMIFKMAGVVGVLVVDTTTDEAVLALSPNTR